LILYMVLLKVSSLRYGVYILLNLNKVVSLL
jgi:hypothetical protein